MKYDDVLKYYKMIAQFSSFLFMGIPSGVLGCQVLLPHCQKDKTGNSLQIM